jgi:hypothetical protein
MVRINHKGHKGHKEKLEEPNPKRPDLEYRIANWILRVFFVFLVPFVVFQKKGWRRFPASLGLTGDGSRRGGKPRPQAGGFFVFFPDG